MIIISRITGEAVTSVYLVYGFLDLYSLCFVLWRDYCEILLHAITLHGKIAVVDDRRLLWDITLDRRLYVV